MLVFVSIRIVSLVQAPRESGESLNRFLRSVQPRQFTTFLVAVSSIFIAIGASTSADEKLPTAQWVLDRYAEVSGERANLPKHKSVTIHGRYEDPANKIEATTISNTTYDGVTLSSYHLTDGRSGASGFDGHSGIGWSLGLSGKVNLITGNVALSMARDADMYYHLHVMKYFRQMEVVGVEDFHGHACYHLKGTNNWGEPNEQFYEKATGLLIGYKFNSAWRGGNGAADNIFEDYKPFDGILFATKQTGHDGNDMDITYTDQVTFDDVKASDLEPPAAVKAKLAETPKQ